MFNTLFILGLRPDIGEVMLSSVSLPSTQKCRFSRHLFNKVVIPFPNSYVFGFSNKKCYCDSRNSPQ